MALILFEGYEHASGASYLAQKWGGTSNTADRQTGRISGSSIGMSAYTGPHYWSSPSQPHTTYIVQTAMNHNQTYNAHLIRFSSATGTQGTVFFNHDDGSFRIYRGLGTGLLYSSPAWVYQPQVNADNAFDWHYMEVYYSVSDTTGHVKVRWDGVMLWDTSGLNTKGATENEVDHIEFRHDSGYVYALYDDTVIMDGSGSDFNDFIGDHHIYDYVPTSDVQANFDTVYPAAPATHYDKVDDSQSDGDSTYIASPTVGDIDTFGHAALPAAVQTVKAVSVSWSARKDNAGSRKISPVVTSGGSDYVGAEVNLTDSYVVKQQTYLTDPSTAAAWDIAGVNNMKFGVKVTA